MAKNADHWLRQRRTWAWINIRRKITRRLNRDSLFNLNRGECAAIVNEWFIKERIDAVEHRSDKQYGKHNPPHPYFDLLTAPNRRIRVNTLCHLREVIRRFLAAPRTVHLFQQHLRIAVSTFHENVSFSPHFSPTLRAQQGFSKKLCVAAQSKYPVLDT
jgi:hypothetical protein